MADLKITELDSGTPKATDLHVAVDTTDSTMAPSGTDKKYLWSALKADAIDGLVTGAASSTDNAVARFDGTTGKIIQNSGSTIDDSGNLTANGLKAGNTVDSADKTAHVQSKRDAVLWLEGDTGNDGSEGYHPQIFMSQDANNTLISFSIDNDNQLILSRSGLGSPSSDILIKTNCTVTGGGTPGTLPTLSGGTTALTINADGEVTANVSFSSPSITASGLSTGVVHSNGSGLFSSSTIVNADVSASAGIVDTKLATISTAGKVSNSATTATATNTASTIMLRDGSGNTNIGLITAATGFKALAGSGGTPSTLSKYEVVTVSTAFESAVTATVTIAYEQIGNMVFVTIPEIFGTAAVPGTIFSQPGTIPTRFSPSTTIYGANKDISFLVFGQQNGSPSINKIVIDEFLDQFIISTYNSAAFSGTCGIYGTTFCYYIDLT